MAKKQQFSCCSADPADIDTDWLSHNTGQLFNTPLLQAERQAMLDGGPVSSCWNTCFRAESMGLTSRRQLEKGNLRTHTDIHATPELVNIVLGSTCNLTCVYCCKQYSSAWARDLEESGSYLEHDRFRLFDNDRTKKHWDIQADPDYTLLLDEVANLSPSTVHISGGEPFLYNNLSHLVARCQASTIKINTGLGVDVTRFKNQIDKLKNFVNLEIVVSGESVDQLYELVRYGNQFSVFETNLQTLQLSGIKHSMINVISNLTVLGMLEFYQRFQTFDYYFLLCNDPDFLSVHVLDDQTKSDIIDRINISNHPARSIILENIKQPVEPTQHKNFSIYIKEFVRRRNISLDVLPNSLAHWIDHA